MNSRERVLAAAERRRPDRPPIDLTCTPEAMAALQAHLGLATGNAVLDRLDVDMRRVGLPFIGPAERSAVPLGSEGVDFWGCRIRKVETEFNTYYEWDGHPLADCKTVADVEAHDWPSLDWWDYSAMPRLIEEQNAAGRRAIMFFAGGAFETPWYLRGLEQFLIDLRQQPEIAEAICRHVEEYYRLRALPCAGSRRRPDRPHRDWRGHRHPARHDAQPRALAAAHQAVHRPAHPHLQVARVRDLLPLVRLDRAGHPRSDRGRAGPARPDPAPGGRHEPGGACSRRSATGSRFTAASTSRSCCPTGRRSRSIGRRRGSSTSWGRTAATSWLPHTTSRATRRRRTWSPCARRRGIIGGADVSGWRMANDE